MRREEATAEVEVRYKEKTHELKCLVDTGASLSVISKKLAEKVGAFTHFEKPYDIRTADREGKLRIIGYCRLGVRFQGIEVPGGAVFEVAENMREDLELVIGRPEIDKWDIVFTPEGPILKKVPIEFEIV